MTTLDDPCQGILLEQPTQNDLSRKLQMLNEVLHEHGITAVSLLYFKKKKLISECIIHHNIHRSRKLNKNCSANRLHH